MYEASELIKFAGCTPGPDPEQTTRKRPEVPVDEIFQIFPSVDTGKVLSCEISGFSVQGCWLTQLSAEAGPQHGP